MAIFSMMAADRQSDAIEDASDAQAAAAREATALQRDIYNQNVGYQTPWMNTGLTANAHMNALLGLNVPQAAATPAPTANPTTPAPGGGNSGFGMNAVLRMWQQRIDNGDMTLADAPAWVQQRLGGGTQGNNVTPPLTTPTITQPTAQAAYDAFRGYTGYQSRLTEANNAMNGAYAARGTLQSGAAQQAMARMNQDYASNEFGRYMGYLGGQQQVGVGATNALSGVGTNYANNAGALAMQNGNNLANSALMQGSNSAGMIQGIGGAFGNMLGGLANPSSYAFSDERLKTKVELLRRDPDGLGWYSWNWKSDPDGERVTGVLAHEVKELRPQAHIENYLGSGFDGVNYAALRG